MDPKSSASHRFEALVFDLFGVLIEFNDDLVTARLADHCADPLGAFGALRDIVSRGDLIRGRLTLTELRSELVERHGLTLTESQFEACWLRSYSRSMPGMAGLIERLAGRHRLVLLSNVDRYYWRKLAGELAELRHFNRLVLSWEVGVAKPERHMFELAVEAAGISASRCFFVDDKPENVEAAMRLGWGGHCFTGVPDLEHALTQAGIL